jgi:hypothetical protein
MFRTMSKSRRDGSTRRRCWTATLLLVLAVAATGCGGKSDHSGTGSSITTSKRSGGGETTATRRPISLQAAFDAARYYLDAEAVSKSALLQRMRWGVGGSFSEAEALYAVNHVGADWKAEAVQDAKGRERLTRLSPKLLLVYLTMADGFSKAEATYAVSHAGRDWNAEAVIAAKRALGADAVSKSQLIKALKLRGFTDAHVRYAVEKVY